MNGEAPLYELARKAQRKAIRNRRRRAAYAPSPPSAQDLMLSPAQRSGRQGEQQAARFLQERGMIVLGRNLRARFGELDLACRDGDVLVFVEVRRRTSDRYGGASASVDPAKQKRVSLAAQAFLPLLAERHFGGATPPCRFDVVTVQPRGMEWLRGAFG